MLSVESNWTVFEKETHVVSVIIPRLETDAIRDERDNRPLSAPKEKAQTHGKIPSKSSGSRGESPSRNKRKDSVPKFPLGNVYESVL